MEDFSQKRVVVTHADLYMGPALKDYFNACGATVLADQRHLTAQAEVDALLTEAGTTDILLANLDAPTHSALADEIDDERWFAQADLLLHPLMRLIRAFLPQMKARRSGKIIAITSAAPLRGIPKNSAYCAYRGAQNAFIRAVGLEVARDNVQVNAVGQNYVENDTYYPPELLATERFQAHLKANVPSGAVAPAAESARLAAFLASDANTHIVGQTIPFAGGWTTST